MRIFNLIYLLLLLVALLASSYSARPDFLNLRRKYHRRHCMSRRCFPLHSRVPFP
ncbi:apelin receptor early endogenous ligand [Nelusetta ayraudi]|uniref:apelin receptor early endogenous ligand n=1 Tax=Nelusetta ayraudi TaxID=303726 RepID=UPI003F70933A